MRINVKLFKHYKTWIHQDFEIYEELQTKLEIYVLKSYISQKVDVCYSKPVLCPPITVNLTIYDKVAGVAHTKMIDIDQKTSVTQESQMIICRL